MINKLAGLEGIHARISASGNILLLAIDRNGDDLHFATVMVLPQGYQVVHYGKGKKTSRQVLPRKTADEALADMYGKQASGIVRATVRGTMAKAERGHHG